MSQTQAKVVVTLTHKCVKVKLKFLNEKDLFLLGFGYKNCHHAMGRGNDRKKILRFGYKYHFIMNAFLWLVKCKETAGNSWTVCFKSYFGSQITSQSLDEVHTYWLQMKFPQQKLSFFIYLSLFWIWVGITDCKWWTKLTKCC